MRARFAGEQARVNDNDDDYDDDYDDDNDESNSAQLSGSVGCFFLFESTASFQEHLDQD